MLKMLYLRVLTFTLISTLKADLFNMMSWFSVLKKVLEVHQSENLFDANPNSSNLNSLASLMGYVSFPPKKTCVYEVWDIGYSMMYDIGYEYQSPSNHHTVSYIISTVLTSSLSYLMY
jgi:hypothetical protein